MIISASRRTDIPAFYSDWLINRLNAGFVRYKNPMNLTMEKQISLKCADVDCLVLWTKNPIPMLPKLPQLDGYDYIVQYTLNGYGTEVEPNIPAIEDRIAAFIKLASLSPRGAVIWRYDPILLNNNYTIEYHIKYFYTVASRLNGYTNRCIISFLDYYKKIEKNLLKLNLVATEYDQMVQLSCEISRIASNYGIEVFACAEPHDLSMCGIKPASCIDANYIESVYKKTIRPTKAVGQRSGCGCVKSVDIGAYNTCLHGCVYCYANASEKSAHQNFQRHDPNSDILIE